MNGNDKHTPGQNMTKEIHRDLVQELVDAINQYNYDYERTEILTRNFNEFEGAAGRELTVGVRRERVVQIAQPKLKTSKI